MSANLIDPADGFSKGVALVIGIAAYQKVSSLPHVVTNDALAIEKVLTSKDYCGFTSSSVTLLLNSQATLSAMRRELENISAKASKDDTVVIYFSGHGARLDGPDGKYGALVPVDADPKDKQTLSDTVLSEAEFSRALCKVKSKRLVVFIDACHAADTGTLKTLVGEDEVELALAAKSLERLSHGTGRVFIASSKASEFSEIHAGARNSVFTEGLLEALEGRAATKGDGLIRVFEVFSYVAETVPKITNQRQNPVLAAKDLETNFPIALDRGGMMKSQQPHDQVSQSKISSRELSDELSEIYPSGPTDQAIWRRAGGDPSRLNLHGNGRTNWFNALVALSHGGGGADVSMASLISAALEDFPNNVTLLRIRRQISNQ